MLSTMLYTIGRWSGRKLLFFSCSTRTKEVKDERVSRENNENFSTNRVFEYRKWWMGCSLSKTRGEIVCCVSTEFVVAFHNSYQIIILSVGRFHMFETRESCWLFVPNILLFTNISNKLNQISRCSCSSLRAKICLVCLLYQTMLSVQHETRSGRRWKVEKYTGTWRDEILWANMWDGQLLLW